MGSQPRSPISYPADWCGPQPGGPGPGKRHRTEEPEAEAVPRLDNVPEPLAKGALTSMVVLPAGCGLHLPLDHVDVLLEPKPTSVLQVSLGDHILMLVPEALLGSGVEGPWVQGLERAAFLSAPGEYMALEPGFFCAAVPEIASLKRPTRRTRTPSSCRLGWMLKPATSQGSAAPQQGCQAPARRTSSQSSGLGRPTPVQREALLTTTTTCTCTFRSPSPTHHSNLYLPLLVRVLRAPPTPSHGPLLKGGKCLIPE
ncbi:proline-rich protein 23A-like [Phocoena phocoena]|uniref:proline-rich protein 23A-like n=1 Tax=Phocoena phocoena TaxID=9742 RepID=UPI00330741CE